MLIIFSFLVLITKLKALPLYLGVIVPGDIGGILGEGEGKLLELILKNLLFPYFKGEGEGIPLKLKF